MRIDHLSRSLSTMAILVVVSVVCASCGGGGGGGDSTSSSAAQAGSIFIPNLGAQGSNFVIAGVQNETPVDVFLNARIRFVFGGAVSASSLPAAGLAIGNGIDIVRADTLIPASGVFSMGPGVGEVFFDAFPPSSTVPGQGCQAGFQPSAEYVIDVKSVGVGGQGISNVLIINGSPLTTGASGRFFTIACDTNNPSDAFDPNGETPVVLTISPAAGFVGPPGAIPGSNVNATILTVDLGGAVDPSSVNASNLLLVNNTINTTTQVPVGGVVTLQQLGSVPGNPSIARITYTTSSPLVGGYDYELLFQGIIGLSGGTIVAPAVGTVFSVLADAVPTPVAFVEDFTTTANRGSLTESIEWPGNGMLSTTLPIAIIGTGADGIGNFSSTMTFNADAHDLPAGASIDPNPVAGEYNFTSLTFGNVSSQPRTFLFSSSTDTSPGEGNFPVSFRSLTTITILSGADLNLDGRQQTIIGGGGGAPVFAFLTDIPGGWGGPGGGRGGTSSPINDVTVINLTGLPGEGAHTDATDSTRPGGTIGNVGTLVSGGPPIGLVDDYYGGGDTGRAGISVSTNPNLGPSGGGGGTATAFAGYMPNTNFRIFTTSTDGETQSGTDGGGLGAPLAGVRGKSMPVMMTPLTFAVGGSGGGASGDRGNQAGANPAQSYRSGGAGGGGGGAIRFTAGNDIVINFATISVNGGKGGACGGLAVAHGGGGSAGSILVQTFGDLQVDVGATFEAVGGAIGERANGDPFIGTEPPLNGEGGRGGDGIVQLEDADGILSGFPQFSVVTGEFMSRIFPSAGTITDMAQSLPIDTMSNGTTYQSASEVSSTGSEVTSTLMVQFFGLAENPLAPGTPATTAMSSGGTPLIVGPFTAAQISELNGYRYFMFEVVTSYSSSATAGTGTITLPSADMISVNYSN
ncbi:MAG: hypothetical protein ACI97A_002260 [Planctomycetota bacterium]|jgi:hypothetical protein